MAKKIKPHFIVKEERLEKLKQLFPEAVGDNTINWDLLKEALGEFLEDETQEHFGLNWPGKKEARKMAFVPPKGTLKLAKGEGINEETTENLFIEGENLEVLKLLQKSYFGKIKMIYIDPPYNTGNDFVYSDNFTDTIQDYLQKTGQADEEGKALSTNPKTSGRFHSNWLSMMYPRLLLAKNLLRDDGVIFVSIDDNEVHNLREIMNEIYGEENLLSSLIWKTDGNFDNQAKIKKCHEYILVYCKDSEKFKAPPVIDPNVPEESKLYKEEIRNTIVKNGPKNPESTISLPVGFPSDIKNGIIKKRKDKWPHYLNDAIIEKGKLVNVTTVYSGWSSKDLVLQFIQNNMLPIIDGKGQETNFVISATGALEVIKKRSDAQSHVISVLTNMGNTQSTSQNLIQDQIYFDYPKPIKLLKYLISMSDTESGFIMLDFFSGSASTAHAILALVCEDNKSRNFILVQLPEPINSQKMAHKAGYSTIAEIGKERIRRVIKKLNDEDENENNQDRGFKVLKLSESNIIKWDEVKTSTLEELEEQLLDFVEPMAPGWNMEDLIIEVLLWEGFSLTSSMEKKKAGKNTFVCVTDKSMEYKLWTCFDTKLDFTMKQFADLGFQKEDVIVFLDSSLNDAIKSRLSDLCRLKVV